MYKETLKAACRSVDRSSRKKKISRKCNPFPFRRDTPACHSKLVSFFLPSPHELQNALQILIQRKLKREIYKGEMKPNLNPRFMRNQKVDMRRRASLILMTKIKAGPRYAH